MKNSIKKDQVLHGYLRADWLRLVDILPDLHIQDIIEMKKSQKKKNRIFPFFLQAAWCRAAHACMQLHA